jgi:hypothetical protein
MGASRECEPRITPPTAAISSTIEVISKASRWSVRNSRPISCGRPKEDSIAAWWESRPLVYKLTTTITSTNRAAHAATAPSVCQLGAPAQGASARFPR